MEEIIFPPEAALISEGGRIYQPRLEMTREGVTYNRARTLPLLAARGCVPFGY